MQSPLPYNMPFCTPCGRRFVNTAALNNHLKHSNQHVYCFRCSRDFVSASAREQHFVNSSNHWLCRRNNCDFDFSCSDDLDEHLEDEHHWCEQCDEFFDSAANLKAHLGWHRARTIECYGCERLFKSVSAMVLHLEYSDQCDSGSDREFIGRVAIQCYASKHYRNYSDNDDYFPFECPDCGVVFRYMSGLLQHAESDRCDVDMEPGTPLERFLRFLRQRLN